jgi:hypothetical protein
VTLSTTGTSTGPASRDRRRMVGVRPRGDLRGRLGQGRLDQSASATAAAQVRGDSDVEVVSAQEGEAVVGQPQCVVGESSVGQRHPGGLVEGFDTVGAGGRRDHAVHEREGTVEIPGTLDVQRDRSVVSTGSADDAGSADEVVGSLLGSTKR